MTTSKTDQLIDPNSAATKIQTFFRAHASRKKYAFKQLHEQKLEDYSVCIKGNDPVIKGLPQHPAQDKIALVGTSGFRSVELACQLSRGTPKLIIIDNSKQVIQFWRQARQLANHSSSKQQFLRDLKAYIVNSKCNKMEFHQIDLAYLEQLFQKYNDHQVKGIIGSATILAQSWADKNILIKVKNILAVDGINAIYAYPSNIVACLYMVNKRQSAQRVLENIAALNPKLAIHTDLDPCENDPKNVLLVTNHNPKQVADKLKLTALDNFAIVEVEPNKRTLVDIETLLGALAFAFIKKDVTEFAKYNVVLNKIGKSKLKLTLSRLNSENSPIYKMITTLNLVPKDVLGSRGEEDSSCQVKTKA
jgi:hypothetical protein